MTGPSTNGPPAREFAASGAFSQRVAGDGFEPSYAEPTVLQTSVLQPESYAADLRVCVPRRGSGPPLSAMRPCVGSRWRGDARTGTDGGVRRLRFHAPIRAFVAFDLRRSRYLLAVAVFLVPRSGLGVPGSEGIGDALVGGVGLPVDAVGVDLQQDGGARTRPGWSRARGPGRRGHASSSGTGTTRRSRAARRPQEPARPSGPGPAPAAGTPAGTASA
jgi:hypothetical protein